MSSPRFLIFKNYFGLCDKILQSVITSYFYVTVVTGVTPLLQ